MHLIRLKEEVFDSHGNFHGLSMEVAPLFGNNRSANEAVYREFWHRMRRDLQFKAVKFGTKRDFDAIIYFSATLEAGWLKANIMVNTANGDTYAFDPKTAKKNAKRALRRMDRMLYQLFVVRATELPLDTIRARMDLNPPEVGNADIKNLLKIYCRSNGFFIDINDVDYALRQDKSRRRKAYQEQHS